MDLRPRRRLMLFLGQLQDQRRIAFKFVGFP